MKYKVLNPKRNKYYSIAIIIALALISVHIYIYQLTIINPWIYVLVAGITGIISSRLDLNNYTNTYQGNNLGFWAFIVNTVIWGFTIVFLFSFTNFYITNSSPEEHTLSIIKTGKIGTRNGGNPTALIEIRGKRKELVFSRKMRKQLTQSKEIRLYTEKGIWGFEVIKEQRLIKNLP